jgi:enamine deaminase RidA (YjgF/YER057c/UK114 family)
MGCERLATAFTSISFALICDAVASGISWKGTIMNKDITRIGTGKRMSEGVCYNGIIWVAGQVGNPGDSVADQTRVCLAEVDRILAEAGTDKTRILSAQIWLADMASFAEMNAVWDAWVPQGNTPARATGEAKLAAPEYLVEIIVTAALK